MIEYLLINFSFHFSEIEKKMEKKVIHEHRLSTPLMIILGIFAFGVVMIGIDGYLIKDAIS